jgi:pyruvyltransferase
MSLRKNSINVMLSALYFLSVIHAHDASGHNGLPIYLKVEEYVKDLPLFYWREKFINFGDYLALVLLERMVQGSVRVYNKKNGRKEKTLFTIGSVLTFPSGTNEEDADVIWGSGANGKWLDLKHYKFTHLDVRAVRGPLTRDFLMKNFDINVPEVYGDPALLLPSFFPEFKKKQNPSREYIIIPHYSEMMLFPCSSYENVVHPTEPWDVIIEKILDSKLVISGSLHGIIVAEAFGIPARWLRVTWTEHVFKFMDYYLGTGRKDFRPAFSIAEALAMGGEKPHQCDLVQLYRAFPFEFWPQTPFDEPDFNAAKTGEEA